MRVAALLTLLFGLFAVVYAAPPASAGECTAGIYCGKVYHGNDTGYDPAIIVRCTYGDPDSNRYVYEGHSSKEFCKDADQVYVRSGEEFWCIYYRTSSYGTQIKEWRLTFDATGWHKIDDLFNKTCTLRKD